MGRKKRMFGIEKEDPKWILSKEAAEKQVQRIFDYLEIEIEELEEKSQKKAIKDGYSRLVKAFRLGRLEINEADGFRIIQHLRFDTDKKNSLTFKVAGAAQKKAMGEKAPTDGNGRMYAMMASCCGMPESALDKLDPVDLGIVEVLGAIFLSV